MEQEISGISKFPEKRKTSRGFFFETIFRKLSVLFDFEPEFPEILVEWNAPPDREKTQIVVTKYGKDFGKRAAHPHPIFLRVLLGQMQILAEILPPYLH